jgi:hypothetical protein
MAERDGSLMTVQDRDRFLQYVVVSTFPVEMAPQTSNVFIGSRLFETFTASRY